MLLLSASQALLITQSKITQRAQFDIQMQQMAETQLHMIENMFPSHVVDHLLTSHGTGLDDTSLAHEHKDITIMFMDIVGEQPRASELPAP